MSAAGDVASHAEFVWASSRKTSVSEDTCCTRTTFMCHPSTVCLENYLLDNDQQYAW